jgi:hypothetical protein
MGAVRVTWQASDASGGLLVLSLFAASPSGGLAAASGLAYLGTAGASCWEAHLTLGAGWPAFGAGSGQASWTATGTIPVYDVARLSLGTATGTATTVAIPAAPASLYKSDGETVDPSSPLLAAWLATYVSPGGIPITDAYGNVVTVYLGGLRVRWPAPCLPRP